MKYIIVYYVVYYCILCSILLYTMWYIIVYYVTLQDCEENISRRETEISRVLNVQLKLQSGPRLDEFNQLKQEFTIMWDNFSDKVCYVCTCVRLCVYICVCMCLQKWI